MIYGKVEKADPIEKRPEMVSKHGHIGVPNQGETHTMAMAKTRDHKVEKSCIDQKNPVGSILGPGDVSVPCEVPTDK
jgi:hypothetical protein